MVAAYAGLSDAIKEEIEGKVAVHDFARFRRELRKAGKTEEEIAVFDAKYPRVEHPVVRTHPETGERAIYVNAAFTQHIAGVTPEWSRELLAHLYAQAAIPEYQCRFRWEANSIAFWRQSLEPTLRRFGLLAGDSADGACHHRRRQAGLKTDRKPETRKDLKMTDTNHRRPIYRLAGVALAGSFAMTAAPSTASAQDAPAAKGGMNIAAAGMNKLDQMLAKADATPDQKTKMKAVMMDAIMSLAAQAQTFKTTGSQFSAALMAPHVDRAGLEAARVSAVAEFDAFSKVMVKALGDAAEVLTPEQRAKLAASAKPKG